jgi:hypothetical protein
MNKRVATSIVAMCAVATAIASCDSATKTEYSHIIDTKVSVTAVKYLFWSPAAGQPRGQCFGVVTVSQDDMDRVQRDYSFKILAGGYVEFKGTDSRESAFNKAIVNMYEMHRNDESQCNGISYVMQVRDQAPPQTYQSQVMLS